MTRQENRLDRLLRSIQDPQFRAEIAAWVAEHEVSPDDPSLGFLHLTLLSEHWLDQKIEVQGRATESASRRIDAETKKALTTIAHQTAGATAAANNAIHETLADLSTQVGIDFEQLAEKAVRRAESGGVWGWTVAVVSSVAVGVVVATLIFAHPALIDRLQGIEPGERQAVELGGDLLARWHRLNSDQQQLVAETLGWTLVPKKTALDTPSDNESDSAL